MSDKETAPWIKERAGFTRQRIYKFWQTARADFGQAHWQALVQEALEEAFAVECTAPAPLYRRDEDGTISVVNEAASPQVTPWKSHFTDSDVTGDTHNYVDTGDGKRLWAQDADEIVKRHNEQALQVTPCLGYPKYDGDLPGEKHEAECPAVEGTSEQAPQELELEQETDGRWLAACTRFPGVMAYGATKEEAIRNAAKVLIESEPQVTPTEQRYPNATPYTIRQEDGTWIAHAIAFDLVGTDSQKEKAVKQLQTCLIAQIAFGMKCGLGVSQCFFPAPPEYWQRPCEFMPLPTEEEIAKCKFEGTSEQASPETIDDGFGSTWSAYCPTCKQKSMYVSRPGEARCSKCESEQASPTPDEKAAKLADRTVFSAGFEAGMRAGEIDRWIPVEEKLPEGAKDVLIRYRVSAQSGLVDSCMSVGWLDGDGHWYGHHNQYFEQEDVTHWQPLPAAPEEKKP
jgi:hypothetical protein